MRLILLGIIATILTYAKTGEEIFKKRCGSCHIDYIPQSKLIKNYENGNQELNLTAPTLIDFEDWVIENFKTMPPIKLSEEEAELLAPYMFNFAEKMMVSHSVKRYSYEEALKKAQDENKIVMIEGYIRFCRGCIKMDREVFVEDRVKKALDKNFVVVKMNMLLEKLPLNLKSMGTPAFYFITKDGKHVIDKIQGTGTVEEFLELLENIRQNVKDGKFLK